ncbi:MAG: methylglyoxal synthase [Thermosynechococcaceae cyanobacterium]
MPNTIALIAHDSCRDALVRFAVAHASMLVQYPLIATPPASNQIQTAAKLTVKQMLPAALGGVTQIAAEVAAGHVLAVILLVDSATPQLEPAVESLLHLCNVHNVAIATNLATAEAIIERLTKTRVAHLIFNPVAGHGNAEQDLALIKELLEPHLCLKVHQTTPEIDPSQLVEVAIAQPADLVIASGGDGTVSAVAGALINTEIPMGIIPRGTANAFAVALGIPGLLPIRNACQVILANQTKTVDAASCNGTPMILLVGIGLEANMIEGADREQKNKWGTLAYLSSGWRALDEREHFDVEIEAEGNIYPPLEADSVTIANVAPPTSVLAQGAGEVVSDDGLLDVTIATSESKLNAVATMLGLLGAAVSRTELDRPNVFHGRTRRLKVTTNPPQKVVVDGEIVGTTPVEVECIPNGLIVFAPGG